MGRLKSNKITKQTSTNITVAPSTVNLITLDLLDCGLGIPNVLADGSVFIDITNTASIRGTTRAFTSRHIITLRWQSSNLVYPISTTFTLGTTPGTQEIYKTSIVGSTTPTAPATDIITSETMIVATATTVSFSASIGITGDVMIRTFCDLYSTTRT